MQYHYRHTVPNFSGTVQNRSILSEKQNKKHLIHTVDTEFSVTNFFVYIFLSMLSGDFLLCQTFWSKYLWIFLAIYVDYS